jgi:predicted nucleic acid-binding protein
MKPLKNNASEISTYSFTPTDEVLLDTNIWFLIYGPGKPGDPMAAVYSQALREMLVANCRIYVDVLVLSEYVNRYARLRHNILLKSTPGLDSDFKKFRKSSSFKSIAWDVAGDLTQILKLSERIESDLPAIDINALIGEYGKGDSDFNDQVLAELCKGRSLKLVTHDADFKDRGLNLLTANKLLLT